MFGQSIENDLDEARQEIERLTALHEAAAARAELAQIEVERLRAYIETLEIELGCGPIRALEPKP